MLLCTQVSSCGTPCRCLVSELKLGEHAAPEQAERRRTSGSQQVPAQPVTAAAVSLSQYRHSSEAAPVSNCNECSKCQMRSRQC